MAIDIPIDVFETLCVRLHGDRPWDKGTWPHTDNQLDKFLLFVCATPAPLSCCCKFRNIIFSGHGLRKYNVTYIFYVIRLSNKFTFVPFSAWQLRFCRSPYLQQHTIYLHLPNVHRFGWAFQQHHHLPSPSITSHRGCIRITNNNNFECFKFITGLCWNRSICMHMREMISAEGAHTVGDEMSLTWKLYQSWLQTLFGQKYSIEMQTLDMHCCELITLE